MSFVYLPEPVEEVSQASGSSNGIQSAMSKLINTAKRCSRLESKMDYLMMPPYGMMLEHSMVSAGVERWILSQPDSPASPGASPGSRKASQTTETSGLTPFALLEKSDRNSVSWRTFQLCLPGLTDISDRYSETWPKAGMMLDGVCYRQPKWERRISGRGSGYWPTPRANKPTGYSSPNFRPTLEQEVFRWPTPTSRDHKDTGDAVVRGNVGVNSLLGRAVEPTKMKGSLDPGFVEYLMGFPIGWTDLKHLGTRKFRKWLGEHGCY